MYNLFGGSTKNTKGTKKTRKESRRKRSKTMWKGINRYSAQGDQTQRIDYRNKRKTIRKSLQLARKAGKKKPNAKSSRRQQKGF